MTLIKQRLNELFIIDPVAGTIIRRSNGKNAGCSKRYINIMIDGEYYAAHNIIWFYVTGELIVRGLDHADMNKKNNSIFNLRKASKSQNHINRLRQSNNSSGFKGVHFHKRWKKFAARIGKDGKRIHLGYFDKPEEAHAAYCAAAQEIYGKFARAE